MAFTVQQQQQQQQEQLGRSLYARHCATTRPSPTNVAVGQKRKATQSTYNTWLVPCQQQIQEDYGYQDTSPYSMGTVVVDNAATCLPHFQYRTPPTQQHQPAQPLAPRLGALGHYSLAPQQQQQQQYSCSAVYQSMSASLHLAAALLEQQQRQQQAAMHAKALRVQQARYAAALARRAQQSALLVEAQHQQALQGKALALAQQFAIPTSLNPVELAMRWSQCLSLQRLETPRLALHLWSRVRGHVNLQKVSAVGADQPQETVLLGCLWIAAKHEECRRGVPPASKIAPLAGVSPKLLGVLEIHLLQLLSWRPLYGWIGRAW